MAAAAASSVQKCGPCSGLGKEEEAITHCKQCDDLLCERCKTQHAVIKVTRSHVLIDLSRDQSSHTEDDDGIYFCQLCLSVGKDQQATKNCEDCEIYICDPCHKQHERIKATQGHKVRSLRAKKYDDCVLCIVSDKITPGVYHCKECEFPLCASCTAKHQKMGATKGHVIVDDSGRRVPNLASAETNSPVTDSDFCTSMSDISLGQPKKPVDQQRAARQREPMRKVPMPAVDQNEGKSRPLPSPDEAKVDRKEERRTTAQAPTDSKPLVFNITSESVELAWEKPSRKDRVDYYEIRYKQVDATKWESFCTKDGKRASATVHGLKCSTRYHFKVRAVYNDEEGPYTSVSSEVTTQASLAKELVGFSTKQDNARPAKYKIPISVTNINHNARTRKCVVGKLCSL